MFILQKIKNRIKSNKLFYLYNEKKLHHNEILRFIEDAQRKSKKLPIELQGMILKAYLIDLKKYMFRFDEWYYIYKLYGVSDDIKKKYISVSNVQKYYRKTISKETRLIFHHKEYFLKLFAKYIQRKYLVVGHLNTAQQKIREFINNHDVIIKPHDGSLGKGIWKLTKTEALELDKVAFSKICYPGTLIEECIEGCKEIQKFHSQSLNTIRVMTAFDGKDYSLFYSFIRFGCGESVVDNAHAGGIFCPVDLKYGRLIGNAVRVGETEEYTVHPDSGISFNGFQIPQWDTICKQCIEAHHLVDMPFVGWDVCINNRGQVEFIEGNHAPDIDLCQTLPNGGLRSRFEKIINDYVNHKK